MGSLDDVMQGLLDSLEQLTAPTVAQIYSQMPSYGPVPPEALASAVNRNLHTALAALRSGDAPAPSMLDGAAQTAQERYAVGVPVEDIVVGFRISIGLIHSRFIDLSMSLGLPPADIVRGSRILWEVGDTFATRIITTYHDLQVEAALRDAQRRVHGVRAFLNGEVPSDASAFSLDPQAMYAAVRGIIPAGEDAERARVSVEASGTSGRRHAVVVIDDGDLIGIVAQSPDPQPFPLGIGPFVHPAELSSSDTVARQCLELALNLGRVGIQGLDELGWRLAATHRHDVSRLYTRRFVSPLSDEGAFGVDLLLAVRSWLEHDRSIAKTAAALNLHVNTVRYRLGRYSDLTGADLTDLDDLIGLVWALELGDGSSA